MKKQCLLLMIGWFMTLLCYGQTGRLFTVDNELSSSMINAVHQDRSGIIWIATEDGLNRYDGAKFITYRHQKEDKYSLQNNYVRFLYEDPSGRFFVGTISGLQQYDEATDRFTTIPLIGKGGDTLTANTATMLCRANGELLLGTTGSGIFRLEQKEGTLSAHQADDVIDSPTVNLLYEDKEGNLWVAAGKEGVFRIDAQKQVHSYLRPVHESVISINSICEDESGNVYIGTLEKGLFSYDAHQHKLEPIVCPDLPDLPIKALYPLSPTAIYVGTDGYGLKVYDTQKKEIRDAQQNVAAFDLRKSKIHTIMKDRFGNLWLGFFQKGVMVISAMRNDFNYMGYKSALNNCIGSCCVMSVFKDHEGTLWVGSDNDGLFKVNTAKDSAIHFPHSKQPSSVPSTIMTVYEDSRHTLWVGSFLQGLFKVDPKTGRSQPMRTLADGKTSIDKMRVYSLVDDGHGRLWIGTMGNGIYYMDLATEKIYAYRDSMQQAAFGEWTTTLLRGRNDYLYVGTYNGLACVDLKTMQLRQLQGQEICFRSSIIYTIYEDRDGTLWIGTLEGLKMFNPRTGLSRDYTTKDGLPNNAVCAITGDQSGHLWISTNYGLARFNPQDGSCISYYAGDGLLGNEFSKGAVCTDSSGEIIFGGVHGLNYFNPQDIYNTLSVPAVYITGFYLHNNSVKKGMLSGGKPIIDCAVMDAKKFHLSYKDNSFSIELSAMEFGNPERITYQYSLDGDHWVSLQPGVNQVSFSDMASGIYHFRVRSVDYMAYSDPKEIVIIISPAWYASSWAQLVYVLLGVAVLYLIIMQIQHRYRVRQELMEHMHAEQMNEAKLQFFINISHEIRTPMTLILGPLQKLIEKDKDAERQKSYQTIARNTERLLLLVNQLMDIRKIDKGQMKLKFQQVDMVKFIRDLYSNFDYQTSAKKIKLGFVSDVQELLVWVDPLNFDKVILNVLSNAIKFTPEQGEITIYLRMGEDVEASIPLRHYFEIVIEDNGVGIDEKEIGRIFDRFYQAHNRINNLGIGTGIGLHLTRSLVMLHHGIIKAENNQGKQGASFIIRLPLGKEHLLPEELAEEVLVEQPSLPIDEDTKHMMASAIQTDNGKEEEKVRTKTKYHVLIVEDDEEIRKYISRELAPDYHTAECANGKEALNSILKKAPDLIISDIMMPELDGITLCRKIRQNITINHLPVILLTAKTGEEDNLEALEIGADAFITKPFSIDILKKTVVNLIKQREQLRNAFSGSQEQAEKVQKIAAKSPDEKLMERVMNAINAQIGNPDLSVEMIAAEVGISRVHLHRKMKELTNQTTRDFIRNVRLKQAAALLAEKRHSIAEVALLTGFSNITYFSTVFKDLYGMTPTAYMEKHQQDGAVS